MMSLTGRFNFHKTWRGYLRLDVQDAVESRWGGGKRRWRRATLIDLAEPEMRALIDLRFKPQFMAGTSPGTDEGNNSPVSSQCHAAPELRPVS
jgi:hypothetical protein